MGASDKREKGKPQESKDRPRKGSQGQLTWLSISRRRPAGGVDALSLDDVLDLLLQQVALQHRTRHPLDKVLHDGGGAVGRRVRPHPGGPGPLRRGAVIRVRRLEHGTARDRAAGNVKRHGRMAPLVRDGVAVVAGARV